MVYPAKITTILSSPRYCASLGDAENSGLGLKLDCGCYIRFFMEPSSTQSEEKVVYSTTGCGYMIAAGETLARAVDRGGVRALRGLRSGSILGELDQELGPMTADRRPCLQAAIEGLKDLFVRVRSRKVREFIGESALICSCFGVSEDSIESAIEAAGLDTIEAVGQVTRAGTACGSCRMVIEELIDRHRADARY